MLSLSPWYVLGYGLILGITWGAGVLWIIAGAPAVTGLDFAQLRSLPALERLALTTDPNFIDEVGLIRAELLFCIVTGTLAMGVARARRLAQRQAEAERERNNLARYFSPNIVAALATLDDPLGRVRRQNVAVLFADLVGFTSFAEHVPPEQAIGLLRMHFDRLGTLVFAHDGTLDKYIGDALMATFGTPEVAPDDATRALRCARAMLTWHASWNRDRAARGAAPIRMGIGLHYGPVVLGNVGSARRLEFTVIGDTVNIAARLERLTRARDADLIVSGPLVEAVRREGGSAELAGLVEGGEARITGREGTVAIWCLREHPD